MLVINIVLHWQASWLTEVLLIQPRSLQCFLAPAFTLSSVFGSLLTLNIYLKQLQISFKEFFFLCGVHGHVCMHMFVLVRVPMCACGGSSLPQESPLIFLHLINKATVNPESTGFSNNWIHDLLRVCQSALGISCFYFASEGRLPGS